MKPAIILCLLLSACVTSVADIREAPVHRLLKFSASHVEMAQCTQIALNGRMLTDPVKKQKIVYGNPFVGYEGVTHYAMVFMLRDRGGVVEFRKFPKGYYVAKSMMARLWSPVEKCAKQLS